MTSLRSASTTSLKQWARYRTTEEPAGKGIMRLTDCGKEGPQLIVNFSRVLIVDPVSGMLKSAAGELTELSSFQKRRATK